MYQGKGVGSALFNAILPHVDKDLIVYVAPYNERAIQFYEKLGFKDTGKPFTEDRHIMPISGVTIPEMEMIIKQN
jgi:GNAT superfamily N-acetyltransferase